MSCQQVSKPKNVTTPTLEDPYVFTESVPTTPLSLFNTQKSRARLTTGTTHFVTTSNIAPVQGSKNIHTQKLPLTQLNGNATRTQASLAVGAATNNIKIVTQSQRQQQQRQQQQIKRIITTNVCIVRPQQQQQQQQQKQRQQPQSPLLHPHTPSLWQTPLLLSDTAVPTAQECSSTLPASLTPSSPSLKDVAADATPNDAAVVSPSAAPLPPSKFHNTTLAQHLQKLQCIKKQPKKISNCNSASPELQKAAFDYQKRNDQSLPMVPSLQAFEASKNQQAHHSDSDLNEIPVNVIFRKPQTTSELTRTLLGATTERVSAEHSAGKLPTNFVSNATATITPTTTISCTAAVSNNLKNVKIISPTLKAESLPLQHSPNNVQNTLKDVVFVQPNIKRNEVCALPTFVAHPPIKNDLSSSIATEKSNVSVVTKINAPTKQPAKLIQVVPTAPPATHELEKDAPSETPNKVVSAVAPKTQQNAAVKQKTTLKKNVLKLTTAEKQIFKVGNNNNNNNTFTSKTAVAVLKLSKAQLETDSSLWTSTSTLPYCIQQHWLTANDGSLPKTAQSREERIAMQKSLLRRQALQLLATHSLQKLPLQAARQRLLCVDRLLRKYKNHTDEIPVSECGIQSCTNRTIQLASFCKQHIANNQTQQIFLKCTAKFADNTQCSIPVFDLTQDMPLCIEHARKHANFNRIVHVQHHQQQQQEQQLPQIHNLNVKKAKATQSRKHKLTSAKPTISRPQKRIKKMVAIHNAMTPSQTVNLPLPALSTLRRKGSTTSLESIASNSHSSNSQQALTAQYVNKNSLAPPALAPLSSSGVIGNLSTAHRMLNFGVGNTAPTTTTTTPSASDLKAHEINQIVAQFAMVANNNNNNHNNHNNHNNKNLNNSNQNYYNYNSNNSMNFINTNSNSNFTSALGSSSSLPSTDDMVTQDMLSICENSSAYASSEDTGLGGLSENELIAATCHDDEIPLADTRLLEEHDLANVLSTLPEDAFNELFTAVRQDERDEVERALELADRHLKTLQQTIGTDSDFFGEFLNVNDEILTDIACGDGLDTSTLFFDSGGCSSNSSSTGKTGTNNRPAVSDIRGLVLT